VTGPDDGPFDVLVVDDDFMVAKLHSRFLAAQPGFRVAGVAHNGADALAAVTALRPDLILLDVHLPDMSGLEVLRVAKKQHPEVDAILVTAAHELDVVRKAWQGGALSYLVKPFGYDALAQRLEHFRSNRAVLAAPDVDRDQVDQVQIDRLFGVPGAVPGPTRAELPKGLSRETAELVRGALSPDEPLSATECADRVGLSRVSARRYLAYLEETGVAQVQLKYGRTGRPERLYRLR
jgi:response regulator of citrate/malate metabolism